MTQQKICRDCKWYRRFWPNSELSVCGNPKVRKEAGQLVSGRLPFCSILREYGPCFDEGKLWEAKPPRRSFFAIWSR
jgi:hypothetical protein